MTSLRGSDREPSVDGMAWSGFDRAAKRVPGGLEAVFRAIGVDPSIVCQPGVCTPLRTYVRYFEVASTLSDNPLFGVRLGAATRAERCGLPGYLALHAPCFRDAVRDIVRTLPTLVRGVHLAMSEDREPPALLWSLTVDCGASRQFTGHANAFFVRLMQAHRGPHWNPLRIHCAMPEPVDAGRYRAIFGCPVAFNAPINAIEIRRRDLIAEKSGADARLYAILCRHADLLFDREPSRDDVVASAQMALRNGFALGSASIDAVSRHLGLSRRGFQRALAERGSSFSALRDAERFRFAHAILSDSDQPVSVIAAKLGYSETAAFSRAFRRHFGSSPSDVRRKRRAALGRRTSNETLT